MESPDSKRVYALSSINVYVLTSMLPINYYYCYYYYVGHIKHLTKIKKQEKGEKTDRVKTIIINLTT